VLLYSTDGINFTTTAPTFATNGTADVSHTVSIEQRDIAGNVSGASSLTFTLDTRAPATPGRARCWPTTPGRRAATTSPATL